MSTEAIEDSPDCPGRVRVLYLSVGSDLYGVGQVLLQLLRRLPADRIEPIVVLPGHGTLCGALDQLGVDYSILPLTILRRRSFRGWARMQTLLMLLPNSLGLASFVRRRRVDIIHTFASVVLDGALAARWTGRRHVWHLHEVMNTESAVLWALFRMYIRSLSDRVLCVSRGVADQFPSLDKLNVVYNGIDVEEYGAGHRMADDRGRLRIGVVGRLSPRKGQDVAIRAFAVAGGSSTLAQATLHVIGDEYPGYEDYRAELRRLVDQLGLTERVHFHGFQQPIRPWFDSLDIVAVPSRLPEGFGLVALEAMASGCPVIASNLPGLNEVVRNGLTGILIEPDDPVALAAALERLLANPELRRSMGQRGAERARQAFDVRKSVAIIIALYQELVRTA